MIGLRSSPIIARKPDTILSMLKRRAFVATLWSGGDIVLRQGLQFSVTIMLARLLSPADFGIVAMLALFTGVASVLMDGGFSAALIQRQGVDHADESTVFWCNLGIAILLALVLFLAAPAIAYFYRTPVLVPLTRLMALVVVLGALGAIHSTLLTKQLDFRTQAKAGVVAALVSGIVAIAMAWRGYGVWALAVQAVAMAAVMTAMLWWLHAWRPAWKFSRASVRNLFGFGGYHLGSSLLEVLYARFYTLLVGRLFGARDLGLYNNAETTRQMPAGFFGSLLARVALPMFSSAAHDTAVLRRGVQLSIRGIMLVSTPVMLGIAALAEPLVLLLFGRQWLPAVSILRVLCLAGVLYPLHAINLQALMAQGHSRLMFRLELAKKAIGIVLILAGAWFGVMGIAWSQVAFSVVALAINTGYTRKLIGYGATAQLRDLAPSLLAAILMSGVIHVTSRFWSAPPWLELGVLVPVGMLVYLALVWRSRMDAFSEVMALLRSARSRDAVIDGEVGP